MGKHIQNSLKKRSAPHRFTDVGHFALEVMEASLEPHPRRLFSVETSGSEGQGDTDGLMPIFPVVLSVADAQLALDALLAHGLMKLHIEVEKEIVIATVDEPLDALQLLDGLGAGVADIVESGVLVHGLSDEEYFVVHSLMTAATSIAIEPCTHGIDGRERIGMALTIHGAATTAHRQTHHCTLSFGAA